MCGITGFNWKDENLGKKMSDCLSYRGPDASGIFSDDGVTLSHRRLSIIDLSHAASQPMTDNKNEIKIIFNGEIYNFKELREKLSSNYVFKTQSDTEVIIAGYREWGKDVVRHLNGIFSFAIWDNRDKSFFCARDHIGVKPFYYYWDKKNFIFASEIKAILIHSIPRVLNADSFNRYMRVLYSPEPETMIKGIMKLPPGSILILKQNKLEILKYYTPVKVSEGWSYEEAKEKVNKTVAEASVRQLISDVPVGVYLSGGIDSSVILSAVSKVKKNIKTFSVGFDLKDDEESEKFNKDFNLAEETSKYFGAEHHPLQISTHDVALKLEEIISHMDDPISNPTAISMAFLSEFAKGEVTVVLTGNGGDELFGGYERYRMSKRVDVLGSIPGVKFILPKRIRGAYEMSALDRLAQFEFEKDKRLSKILDSKFFVPMEEIKRYFSKYIDTNLDKTEALMTADILSWLPDYALLLSDKMSMKNSIEERVPLLDREVLDLSNSLPMNFKVNALKTKKILKNAFKDDLPEALFKEPKRGWFSPGAKWLRRNEITAIFKEVLSPGYNTKTQNLFDWKEVKIMLDNHIEKREYNLTILWAIMTFQIWAKRYNISL